MHDGLHGPYGTGANGQKSLAVKDLLGKKTSLAGTESGKGSVHGGSGDVGSEGSKNMLGSYGSREGSGSRVGGGAGESLEGSTRSKTVKKEKKRLSPVKSGISERRGRSLGSERDAIRAVKEEGRAKRGRKGPTSKIGSVRTIQ